MTELQEIVKGKILAGRKAVDAYREAHRQLHSGGWYKGISEAHTPLLEKLVADLEKTGVTSTEKDFEPKKNEILAKFWAASDKECLVETEGIISGLAVYKDRQDIAMLGQPRSYKGVELKETADGLELVIDDKLPAVMNTSVKEHFSMFTSAEECPNNARVFIGGLGLGLILLYLGKAKEVVVCEIDNRVTHLLGERITNYLNIPVEIVKGNAFEEINNHGKFDWVYIDLTEGAPPGFEQLTKPALADKGIYTPYNPMAWQVWK